MSFDYSIKISGSPMALNAGFQAASLDFSGSSEVANPILHIDHFRMSDLTFAPHPHAGFSAISYIFDDSAGEIRNRDSLGNDFVVGAGGMVWTQAGTGVVHDELPNIVGKAVHGLQIFVNLSAANKHRHPEVFRLDATQCPIMTERDGTVVKVVSGQYAGVQSPLVTAEVIDLLDVSLVASWELDVPEERNMVICVAAGAVRILDGNAIHNLKTDEAIAVHGTGVLQFNAEDPATRVVILSGRPLLEPIAKYGPFVMNDREELQSAIERYQRGDMGVLLPLDHRSGAH